MLEATTAHQPSADEAAEYERRLAEATSREQSVPVRKINGRNVGWSPLDGSQNEFMDCRLFEALYHGTRGPGKTDGLLMSFAQHVGRGHGAAWRGIIFRQTYPQLADVQAKSEKWFKLCFGERCKFNRAKMMWEWDTGEVLLLRHMGRPADYWNYHGHEYPFIGWEELCNWADDQCYLSMFSCCRCSVAGVPRMVRATTNPYGPGHSWVKERFRLHGEWWRTIIITDSLRDGLLEPIRVAIHGHIDENTVLLAADPNYKQTVIASASNPAMAEAWLHGSWDIVAGGMFSDVFKAAYNLVEPFAVPPTWRIDRAFDWGSSKPFSVGWYAESNGEDLRFPDGRVRSTVKGDVFRVKEWYGFNGHPNQGIQMLAADIAKGIVERELMWGWRTKDSCRVKAGPADNSIHDVENGVCIAMDMQKPVRVGNDVHKGIVWTRADKSPGSRKNGWEQMRKMLRAAHPPEKRVPREEAGLFVVGRECPQWIRTVPNLPRKEKDMDDVDSDAEDHIGDENRYRVASQKVRVSQGRHTGMY